MIPVVDSARVRGGDLDGLRDQVSGKRGTALCPRHSVVFRLDDEIDETSVDVGRGHHQEARGIGRLSREIHGELTSQGCGRGSPRATRVAREEDPLEGNRHDDRTVGEDGQRGILVADPPHRLFADP
jgi:hypothetical protein